MYRRGVTKPAWRRRHGGKRQQWYGCEAAASGEMAWRMAAAAAKWPVVKAWYSWRAEAVW